MTSLEERRDREIATARANVGRAREQMHRAERALANLETYWAQHPAEVVR
jgi:hypothetical protein